MSIISIFLILFMITITLLILIDSAKNGITPTPTTSKEKAAALKISESLHPSSIADLGAGFGTMAFPLAKQFPDAKVVAYETATIPWIFLLIRRIFQPRTNLSIRRKNFMKEDLSSYDLLYTYLYPKAMDQLQDKISHQRTTMISNCFAMPDWKPSLIWPVESKVNYSSIYLYRRN
ncbi:hypothetical protein GCM10010954_25090 [Halobacillus andaensis]|uniref:Uncharacterized protein n=1 Tax=Halobacillus andaensis TaxID=1176239 RepID=A0A917B686_HALAA|nr:class I SAM-dependent methyltransferase [Halobacillus andaensis]MBP2005904.1 hypothetical protein [Halobacillus andaensis]GGF25204.1 hypothetical protein GCM10010954_25090 [Halobacillus andaensis]